MCSRSQRRLKAAGQVERRALGSVSTFHFPLSTLGFARQTLVVKTCFFLVHACPDNIYIYLFCS